MLSAVKASALRADRACPRARLRALTAPARGSAICTYVMAGSRSAGRVEMVEFDVVFARAYSADIASVSHDTSSASHTSACGARFRSSPPRHDPTHQQQKFGVDVIAPSAITPHTHFIARTVGSQRRSSSGPAPAGGGIRQRRPKGWAQHKC